MATNIGTISQGGTARFYFSTAAADGGEENFSATLEEADILVHKDGSVMTLDASTITITNVATGLYKVEIDTSNDSDFAAGSEYWVLCDPNDETIDSQAVSGVIGVFWIATDIETSLGLMSGIHASYTVGTTGNDTTHVHLNGITATMGDDEVIGEILLLYDVSTSEYHYAVITDFANSGDLATVENLQGGALPFTPASGDYYWRTAPGVASGLSTAAKAAVNAEADTALSDYDPPTNAEMVAATGAIETDTQNIQSRIPAALSSDGYIKADIQAVDDAEISEGGSAPGSPFGQT